MEVGAELTGARVSSTLDGCVWFGTRLGDDGAGRLVVAFGLLCLVMAAVVGEFFRGGFDILFAPKSKPPKSGLSFMSTSTFAKCEPPFENSSGLLSKSASTFARCEPKHSPHRVGNKMESPLLKIHRASFLSQPLLSQDANQSLLIIV